MSTLKRILFAIFVFLFSVSLFPVDALVSADFQPDKEITYQEMEYIRPDIDEFEEEIQKLLRLNRLITHIIDTQVAAINQYYLVEEFYYKIITMETLAYIRYRQHMDDAYWVEEYALVSEISTDAWNRFFGAVARLFDHSSRTVWINVFGEENAAYLQDFEADTEEQLDLFVEEQDYAMNFSRLYAELENAEDADSFDRLLVDVAQNYIELIKIRQTIADTYSFEQYPDMANYYIHYRDFDNEMLAAFLSDVKTYFVPLCLEVEEIYFTEHEQEIYKFPVPTGEELIQAISESGAMVELGLDKPWQELVTRGLYDLGPSDTKMSGGITMYLPLYDSPFIMNKPYEPFYDYQVLIHEFGHFSDSYFSSVPFMFSAQSVDVAEIASQALELLFIPYYSTDEDFTHHATFESLFNILDSIVSYAYWCEFEMAAYSLEEPDIESLLQLSRDIGIQYWPNAPEEAFDYQWLLIPHIHTRPLYSLSYSISGIAATQLWIESLVDSDKSMQKYKNLLGSTMDGYGYYYTAQSFDLIDIFSSQEMETLVDNLRLVLLEEGTAEDIDTRFFRSKSTRIRKILEDDSSFDMTVVWKIALGLGSVILIVWFVQRSRKKSKDRAAGIR